ncbi:hypothetical protein ABWH96_16885 [Marivirga tractuosa]|uniref:hypothetical protein n=1 Tax=Marivirga tractuosa TaxID=1006 RepID=UPI0035CFDC8A
MNNLKYKEIDSPLSVNLSSDDLDMLQIGVLGSQMHKLLKQMALVTLEEENANLEKQEKELIQYHIPQTLGREDVLVRAKISSLRQGSIEIDIAAMVALVFSQANAISLLQNLSANAIWAIGEYATKVTGVNVISRKTGRDSEVKKTVSRRRLGPMATKVIKELKDTANGGRLELRSGEDELIIEIYSGKKSER